MKEKNGMSKKENSGAELSPLERLKSYSARGLSKELRTQWEEGRAKFHEWESDIYGDHAPLSDKDMDIWIEGYLYADREEVK